MEYYYSTTVQRDFEEAIKTTTEALTMEGFGVVSIIDMQAKMKEKLGVDYKKYTILGACNPPYAYKSILAEEKIGVMLPCNVVIIDQGNGNIEIAAVNPVASMMAIENKVLEPMAVEIADKLKKIINSL